MKGPEARRKVGELASRYEREFHGCSQAVVRAFQETLGFGDSTLFRASGSLVGGMYSGLTCGALTGGLLVLGLRMGRARMEEGIEGLLASFDPAQRLVKWFQEEYGTTLCRELTETDWFDVNQVMLFLRSPEKLERCVERVGRTAEKVAELLEELGMG
ncbi:MAG: C-GCAxxG-C-C family protein [Candidatus Hadarchaeales archaeon]